MEHLTLNIGDSAPLHGRPARVGTLHFPAGTHLPPTSHEQDEVSFIVQGVLRAVSGGRAATLRGGDVSFIPAGEVHEADVLEDVTLHYVLLDRL